MNIENSKIIDCEYGNIMLLYLWWLYAVDWKGLGI